MLVRNDTRVRASPFPSVAKASSSWIFCRFSLMRRASYSPLRSTPCGDRSGLRRGESIRPSDRLVSATYYAAC